MRKIILFLALTLSIGFGLACDPEPRDCEPYQPGTCGWSDTKTPVGYHCGVGIVEDPDGLVPYDCPAVMVEGAPCDSVGATGCCDPQYDNWRCVDGQLVKTDC